MSENNSGAPASNAPADSSGSDNGSEQNTNEQSFDNSDGGQISQQAAEQAVAKKIRSLKIKIDGQEYDEQLPFEIDENNKEQVEYLKRHLQMSKVSNKRMQEASKLKSQSDQFIRMLQEDPMKILTHEQFGGEAKFRKMAEEYLLKEIQEKMLTPEERQQRDMEAKLRQYEEVEKQRRAESEAKQMEQLQNHYAQEFEKTIVTGLRSQGIPKTPRTVKRMAELMSKNLQHGLDLAPEQLAQLVKEDYVNEMKEMFGASEGDILLNLLGDDVSNKIRKADLAKLRAGGVTVNKSQTNSGSSNQSESGSVKMSRDEWREAIDKRSKS